MNKIERDKKIVTIVKFDALGTNYSAYDVGLPIENFKKFIAWNDKAKNKEKFNISNIKEIQLELYSKVTMSTLGRITSDSVLQKLSANYWNIIELNEVNLKVLEMDYIRSQNNLRLVGIESNKCVRKVQVKMNDSFEFMRSEGEFLEKSGKLGKSSYVILGKLKC